MEIIAVVGMLCLFGMGCTGFGILFCHFKTGQWEGHNTEISEIVAGVMCVLFGWVVPVVIVIWELARGAL